MNASPSFSPNLPLSKAVRQCAICQKPFLKESSYSRHVAYCRRARQRTRARAKACQACSLAKVKCDLQPQCQRCLAKGIDCLYDVPANSLSSSGNHTVARDSQGLSGTEISAPIWPLEQVSTPISNEVYTPMPPQDTHIDWNLIDFDASLITPRSPKDLSPCLSDLASRTYGSVRDNSNSKSVTDLGPIDGNLQSGPHWSLWKNTEKQELYALSRNTCLADPSGLQHLSPIPSAKAPSNYTTKMIMEMLRAFIQMMVRRHTFPPFIHGNCCKASESAEPVLPEPLLNCMGLAQVFVIRSSETRSFIWRTIQSEQRTAIEKADRRVLSSHALLASIQAQLMFIIMRMNDQSVADPGLNFQLLVIFQRLCEKLKALCNQPFYQQENHNPSSSWEDWIFAESRRRTAVVWLLITQMVHIKIGVACDSFEQFREIPLPAPRSLWEARSRAEWQSQIEVYQSRPSLCMETVGDLISATGQSDTEFNQLRLDLWNAGIDNLGLMLNLSLATMSPLPS